MLYKFKIFSKKLFTVAYMSKIMTVIYLLGAVLVLIATCTYMTQYNFISPSVQEFKDACYSANNLMLYLLLISLAGIAIMCIFGNSSRKKLYKSNLIVGIVVPLIVLVVTIITLVYVIQSISIFNENFEVLKAYDASINPNPDYNFTSSGLILALILLIVFGVIVICYSAVNTLKYFKTNKNHREVGVENVK